MLERFAVAAALQEMPQLRIDTRRQSLLQLLNSLGNILQPRRVPSDVAPTFFVANDLKPFAERFGKFGQEFRHRKSLKR